MRCPSCGHTDSKVVDSRPSEDGTSIRRRRECLKCNRRFTTYERLGENPLVVRKSDGTSEVYRRDKILRGLYIACAKRHITPDQINSVVDDLETELRNKNYTEIQSKALGDMVLQRLRNLDEVAYIRFASVYKDFKNVDEFNQAIKGL
ncbi:MAG: transcriptional regulator NrdR [Eggerthellaceae bacterium]|jgi:transcriptional repressor NrdR|uniref:Transcriptional repressor NrdR n=1 Tax=Denitrobacterium detoxificans TaxID=79604 RepID=A0A172RY81_9ACTN|nr:transcriptional regulator NrdR [Denitrobacterium detoxificans]ANE22697.1 NrdR family transcriptional regulator [Denitrobacterium detoxificans]MBE6466117.1 transcriptional repressor NrdR [Denitrobacterium detoxificans]MCR5583769.1 transcriptional regulator NrdR [Eggerthellaceae bacterium]SEO87479.1 transcriptional repressor NrdR [Denitrobacterium detoxificans]